MMNPVPPREENPCRPRHYKPDPCGPAPLEGPARQSLDTSHTRLLITAALFCLAFAVDRPAPGRRRGVRQRRLALAHRDLTTAPGALPRRHRRPQRRAAGHDARDAVAVRRSQADSRPQGRGATAPPRAARPRRVRARRQARLRQGLHLDQAPTDAARGGAVNRLGIPGLQFREPRASASIPRATSLAHVVGYTDTDSKGLAGIERGLDQRLRRGGAPMQLVDRLRGCNTSCARRRRRRSPNSTPSAAWASSWT